MDELKNAFYLGIEEGVREWVYRLRNAGINTECSCHHEAYIQCQTVDPTEEIRRIKSVFLEHKVEDFEIRIQAKGCCFSILEIWSPVFIRQGERKHEEMP